jgi:bifunctional non-homologous end joining protein LigD
MHDGRRRCGLDYAELKFKPMRARKSRDLPTGDEWVYEPARSGTRVIAYVTPAGVELRGASGVNRTQRFPDVANELRRVAERMERSFVLDGEVTHRRTGGPTLHVFDLLVEDEEELIGLPYHERRERLEELFKRRRVPGMSIVQSRKAAGKVLDDKADDENWRGIVAKREDAPYLPGSVTMDWVRVTR